MWEFIHLEMRLGKRFGVLLCAPDQSYVKKKYGGYFTLNANFLSEAGEKWDLFSVVDGQFPDMDYLYKDDGFQITGSRYDAHGNDVWILKLCHLLQTLNAMGIKILGIRFGHQVLCRALGGKTGRASAGWDIGLRKITVFDNLSAKYPGLKIPSMISIIECHQDKVFPYPVGRRIYIAPRHPPLHLISPSPDLERMWEFIRLEMRVGKRFGVLLCAPDQEYVKKKYGGYFSLYANFLSEAGEKWDFFRVVDGQFPDMDDLYKYDGFVITGSRYDAHGNDVWILKLCHLLQTINTMGIKILGICFGHQILCRALGGNSGRALVGWDLGLRKITVFDNLLAKYSSLKIPSMMSIIECHQDKVYEVPFGAEILASSLKTDIEMFSLGDNILGIQGHPEYTSDILFILMDILLDKNLISEKMSDEARASFRNSVSDSNIWQKICKLFLKS
jgi:GMP synthase-like glutamine amidotransferase